MKEFLIGLLVAFVAFLGWRVIQLDRTNPGGVVVNPPPVAVTPTWGLSIPMPTQGGEAQPPIDIQPALDVYATIYAAQTQMIEHNLTQVAEFQATMMATPEFDRNGFAPATGIVGTHDTGSSNRTPRAP
jgi:hypothetical protein